MQSVSVCLFVCLSVSPSACLSVFLSVFLYVYMPVCLSACLPACLPTFLSNYLSIALKNFQFSLKGKTLYDSSNVKSSKITAEVVIFVVFLLLGLTMTHC